MRGKMRKGRVQEGRERMDRAKRFFPSPPPQVFAGIYPLDQSEYVSLRTAIDKLILNDSSVTVHRDSSIALGQGWRVGFLGLLHMDVFRQRLEEVCHDRKRGRGGGQDDLRSLASSLRSMMLPLLSHLPVFLTEVCCYGNCSMCFYGNQLHVTSIFVQLY